MLSRVLGNNSKILWLNELHYIKKHWYPGSHATWGRDTAKKATSELLATARRSLWNCKHEEGEIKESVSIVAGISKSEIRHDMVYTSVLSHLLYVSNKSIAIDQTPRNICYAKNILNTFPNARLVQLVRDPRAVLLSQRSRWRQRWLGAQKYALVERVTCAGQLSPIHYNQAMALIVIHKSVIPAGIAGIQTTWKYLSSSSLTTSLWTGHGTEYPLPGGYDELPVYLCITMRAIAWGIYDGINYLLLIHASWV